MTPILIIAMIALVIFFVMPQLAKFRATLGINQALKSKAIGFVGKLRLRVLGLKTPFISGLAMLWSFVIVEGDSLSHYAWEQIVSREHAAWIAFSLWAIGLWSHFSGLNAAAATPPVITPLPGTIETAR